MLPFVGEGVGGGEGVARGGGCGCDQVAQLRSENCEISNEFRDGKVVTMRFRLQ
jgi:hypothetical protein